MIQPLLIASRADSCFSILIILLVFLTNIVVRNETVLSTNFMNKLLKMHLIVNIPLDKVLTLILLFIMLIIMFLHHLILFFRIQFTGFFIKILATLLTLPCDIFQKELWLSHESIPKKSIINLLPVFSNQINQTFETVRQGSFIIKFIANFDSVNEIN